MMAGDADFCPTCGGPHMEDHHRRRELVVKLRDLKDREEKLNRLLREAALRAGSGGEEVGADIADTLASTKQEIAELEDALDSEM